MKKTKTKPKAEQPKEEVQRKFYRVAVLFTVHHESAIKARDKLQQALKTFEQYHSFVTGFLTSEAVLEKQDPPATIKFSNHQLSRAVVHHKDRNPLNHTPSNLVVMNREENAPPKKNRRDK